MENGDLGSIMSQYFYWYVGSLMIHDVYVKGNMVNISKTILINISKNTSIIENALIREDCSLYEIQIYTNLFKEFHGIFSWTYEEILGIDPKTVKHEIKTYENVKPI